MRLNAAVQSSSASFASVSRHTYRPAARSWNGPKLKAKNTPLHEASVVGDTVGDPFNDTSSVALNPVIKFTTLFGLLAVELAVSMTKAKTTLAEINSQLDSLKRRLDGAPDALAEGAVR